MRTRAGFVYPRDDKRVEKRGRDSGGGGGKPAAKKIKPAEYDRGNNNNMDFFDSLHDDLVVTILCKLSSSASCPGDFINVLSTCKRFNGLALRSMVLSKASTKMLSVKAKNWSESAHRFLKFCADAGNIEACYILGMIRFYCLQNRGSGASLMAKAAIGSHAPALYSLAVIQFNGSGGQKCDKDLRAGVALCARAAFLGHIDALRELGHCLQDGYGVKKNFSEGRRFLVQANARELASVLASNPEAFTSGSWMTGDLLHQDQVTGTAGGLLYTDFGCNVPVLEAHPANRFLTEWFEDRGNGLGLGLSSGLRQCSHMGCGRPETRKHEFRRCSVCGAVNYCSRACQALDWKMRHKAECVAVERWLVDDNGVAVVNVGPVDGVNGGGEFNGNVNGNEDLMVVDS